MKRPLITVLAVFCFASIVGATATIDASSNLSPARLEIYVGSMDNALLADDCVTYETERGTRCGDTNSLWLRNFYNRCGNRVHVKIMERTTVDSTWGEKTSFFLSSGETYRIGDWWCKAPYSYRVEVR